MNGYKAFYRGKTVDVYADTSYAAQVAAAKLFGIGPMKTNRRREIVVVLCEKDGGQVAHQPQDICA